MCCHRPHQTAKHGIERDELVKQIKLQQKALVKQILTAAKVGCACARWVCDVSVISFDNSTRTQEKKEDAKAAQKRADAQADELEKEQLSAQVRERERKAGKRD
jgi:hypothetical protein